MSKMVPIRIVPDTPLAKAPGHWARIEVIE